MHHDCKKITNIELTDCTKDALSEQIARCWLGLGIIGFNYVETSKDLG